MNSETMIVVGKFGKTHGLNGAIRINSYTKPDTNIFNYQPWTVADKPVEVSHWQQQGKHLVAQIQDVDHIDTAKLLTEQTIYIPRAMLPETAENEYYWDDLIGFQVINTEQQHLGEVEYLTEGAQFDMLVVKRPGKQPLLVPYEPEVILAVEQENKIIKVNWDDIDDSDN